MSVEVHHIIPEASGGEDTIENAAPLCAYCHSLYGDNPIKRKEITEMRDWWYEQVIKIYNSNPMSSSSMETISNLLEKIEKNQESLQPLQSELKKLATYAIDHMTIGTANATASEVADLSTVPTLSVGGDGGKIFIFANKIVGAGKITADGGSGNIAGAAGEIHIKTNAIDIAGEISAKGGKSKK